MFEDEKITLENSYKNPFEDFNANVLEPRRIVEYWCNPFTQGLLTNIDEFSFRTNKMPIILQGSRGSGKTMILKYYAYKAQLVRSEMSGNSFLHTIMSEGEVGFYYRFDESFIKTFKNVFEKVNPKKWSSYFDFYLEMDFCKSILEVVLLLIRRGEIELKDECKFVKELLKNVELNEQELEFSVEGLYQYVITQVNYINGFKKQYIFTKEKFQPSSFLELFELSSKLVLLIKEYIPEFKNVVFVLLFDEFENLTDELQKRFNTLIKFANESISIRVGRRSEAIVSNETINSSEYLRENHDYCLASLDKEFDNKDNQNIRDYFLEVAKRRFAIVSEEKEPVDIVSMLGEKENLDDECIEICKGKKKHIESILSEIPEIREDKELLNRIICIIKNDENPIAETLNALWIIRKKGDYIRNATETAKVMKSFFAKDGLTDTKKYASDYTNKYRYAITVFICSVYRKPKLYYSFNDICYLANGNTRTFINLCREIINDALFYEKSSFLDKFVISKETQSRAIHNYSYSEFNEICAIIQYGNYIRNFILNVGNCFAAYHKDKKIRYPETNQFAIEDFSLEIFDQNVIRMAESWAMIIKKEKTQRITAGVDKKGDIYHINRIFAPIFNISYRTRGGVNPTFSKDTIHRMINEIDYVPIDLSDESNERKTSNRRKKKQDSWQENKQMSLFDYVEVTSDDE